MQYSVAVVNHSGLTVEEVESYIKALNVQAIDLANTWGISASLHIIATDADKLPDEWLLALLEDSDQAEALGYHDIIPDGQPLGKVFVKTTQDANQSVSVCFSHEFLEMMVDQECNLAALNQTDSCFYAYEICDPVQADACGYTIDGVLVSDFVLPTYFCNAGASPYSFKQNVQAPFTLASGGYCSYLDVSKTQGWQQKFGDNVLESDKHIIPQSRRDIRIKKLGV